MRIVCSLALSLATLANAQECAFQDAFDVRGDGSLLLRQFVADERATIQLEYAGTGWLGFAFTEQPVMIPNVAVIGLPDDGTVLKYDLMARSLDGVIPVEDERQTLTDASIFQNSTHTVLTFSKLLEEENEVSANAESNQFNFAIGSSNDLAIHAIRGTATAPFSECVAATAAPTSDQQTEAPQESPIEEPAAAPVGAPTWEPPTWQPPTWGPPEDPCKAQRDTANACLSTAGSCATCINKAHWDIFAEKSTVTCTEYEDGICSAITAGCMECGKCSGQLEEYFECTMFDLSKGVCRGIDCAPVEAGGGGQVLRLDLADGEVEVVLTPDETAGTIKVDMLYSGLGYIGFGFSDNNEMPGKDATHVFSESLKIQSFLLTPIRSQVQLQSLPYRMMGLVPLENGT